MVTQIINYGGEGVPLGAGFKNLQKMFPSNACVCVCVCVWKGQMLTCSHAYSLMEAVFSDRNTFISVSM